MKLNISFVPVRSDDVLTAEWFGSSLILNGVAIDLSEQMTEPAQSDYDDDDYAPPSPWLLNGVTKTGDTTKVTVLLPYDRNSSDNRRNPEPIEVVTEGPIPLPV